MEVLPEKYYESCVSYNIVNYYKDVLDIKLIPFTISQVKENEFGYDFGYSIPEKGSFLLQYKRPNILQQENYSWNIDKSQLQSLIHNNNLRSYYCLPAFNDIMVWHEALDHTFFVNSQAMEKILTEETTKTLNYKKHQNNLFNIDQLVVELEEKTHLNSAIAEKLPEQETYINVEHVVKEIRKTLASDELVTIFTVDVRSNNE